MHRMRDDVGASGVRAMTSHSMTPADLRDEGVFEVGRVHGTTILFVVTEERVLLCPVALLPARRVCVYLADVAIARMEAGDGLRDLAYGLGVTEDDLRSATRARGYAGRPSTLRGVGA